MRKTMRWAFGLGLLALCMTAHGQSNQPWDDYEKLIKTRSTVGTMGPDLFGDQVNYYTGGLSFSATDISIPGNSRLPVALSRTFAVSNRKGYPGNDLPMADWDLDVPRLNGVPNVCATTQWTQARPPAVSMGGITFQPEEYWFGSTLILPGGGGGEMLLINPSTTTPKPSTGGPYYWVAGQSVASCLASRQNNAAKEGYLVLAPDGTKYWFDWEAKYRESTLQKAEGQASADLVRHRTVLYATKVEDRFGNRVTYTYTNDANSPARLASIDGTDGRRISLNYNGSGHVESASDGVHTWQYSYNYADPSKGSLSAVVLPDAKRWTIDFAAYSTTMLRYVHGEPGEQWRDCVNPGDLANEVNYVGSITHPSGARGEFTIFPTRFGRNGVPKLCGGYRPPPYQNPAVEYSYYPVMWDAFALVKKRISGPGLTDAEWNYEYFSGASFATGPLTCSNGLCTSPPECRDDANVGEAVISVTGPEGFTRYSYGNRYRCNEGKLIKVERGESANAIKRTETMTYALAQTGQLFLTPTGTSPQPRGDGFTAEYPRPQTSSVIALDGATFTNQVDQCSGVGCFDVLGRPTRVIKSSSLGYSKSEATEYYDYLPTWVLGQVKRQYDPVSGVVAAEADYDATSALPVRQYAFGKLQSSLAYNADGTLATVKDGRNNTTTLSSWWRGVPRSIAYADGKSESAVVNDYGWIMSVTDENGFVTGYDYDVMGRWVLTVQPIGDPQTWNDTTRTFDSVATAEYGLPAGHWKETISTGNARSVTYFDALWRPVVTEKYDAANAAATRSVIVNRYDQAGRSVFQSYPMASLVDFSTINQGTRTSYDVLGRPERVEQDSELGTPLLTKTEYRQGFVRYVTNPRGQSSTTTYQAFDSPDAAQAAQVTTPDGGTTAITRDIYGKPTAITRWGPGL